MLRLTSSPIHTHRLDDLPTLPAVVAGIEVGVAVAGRDVGVLTGGFGVILVIKVSSHARCSTDTVNMCGVSLLSDMKLYHT